MIDIERLHRVIEGDNRRQAGNTFANAVLVLQSIVDGRAAFANRAAPQYLVLMSKPDHASMFRYYIDEASNKLFLDDPSVNIVVSQNNRYYRVYVNKKIVGELFVSHASNIDNTLMGRKFDNIFVDHFTYLDDAQKAKLSICLK